MYMYLGMLHDSNGLAEALHSFAHIEIYLGYIYLGYILGIYLGYVFLRYIFTCIWEYCTTVMAGSSTRFVCTH